MSTNNYSNMLNEINKKIKNGLQHDNIIVIGDNSTGKSELLKLLIDEDKNYYFIDSVNRRFDFNKISNFKIDNKSYNFENVLKSRVNENYFNLEDSFDFDLTGTGTIEKFYVDLQPQLAELFKGFLDLDIKFEYVKESFLGERPSILIGDDISKISTGFQAILRLFLELLFFSKSLEISRYKNGIIVIDEIDEFLSVKNETRILNYLMNKFDNLVFIVSTHSDDIIANTKNCNVVVLLDDTYEILDGDDYNTVTDVRELFNKIFELQTNSELNSIDFELRNLLNSKINNIWSDTEKNKLQSLESKIQNLSTTQKLLINQVKSW